MNQLKLYTSIICPFAQRARIMLELKKLKFELIEIDLSSPRPDWFLRINPLGQVPVIVHGESVLNESSIICEYLEDAFEEPRTFSRDPYKRALSRILVDYCNQKFMPALYRLLMNQDREKDAKLREEALATWKFIDEFLTRHNPEGVYLDDDAGFSLAEVNIAPFFVRYCLNEYYRGFSLPEGAEYARVRRFRDALLAHPAVQTTGLPADDFIKLYYDYSRGYGNGSTASEDERSSLDMSVPLAERPMPPQNV